ncbi:ribonuclease hi [Plakobranchus ocellatus]|uniref:Ribonuclease hi n=1 Tax=Plakobranchus ocellatus TaxID=259542 RepID=A0AAV4CM29_9GAST|nr:ribonuclease hi [Plakobranchus ocellatus]
MFTSLLSGFLQGNENVDKLAKAALNRASCSGKLICWSDLKAKMNAYINSIWQRDWDAEGANKLHEVLPNLGEDVHRRGEGAGRKRETAMCRLRVGHTWLTQSYLLKNEDQPFCYACDSLYTVRHILIECPDFQDTKRKYFSVTDLFIAIVTNGLQGVFIFLSYVCNKRVFNLYKERFGQKPSTLTSLDTFPRSRTGQSQQSSTSDVVSDNSESSVKTTLEMKPSKQKQKKQLKEKTNVSPASRAGDRKMDAMMAELSSTISEMAVSEDSGISAETDSSAA